MTDAWLGQRVAYSDKSSTENTPGASRMLHRTNETMERNYRPRMTPGACASRRAQVKVA
jgi:hypothetical protein